MVGDGADTADAALGDALLGMKADGLPVFTVGVGRETLPKDIQVGRVVTPKTALKGTTLMVDVVLSQSGFDGQPVTLDVDDTTSFGPETITITVNEVNDAPIAAADSAAIVAAEMGIAVDYLYLVEQIE